MAKALLGTGKHTVTALTRQDSQSKLPEGVQIKTINYTQPKTIVEALKGQDALVMTLGTRCSKDTPVTVVNAAAEAGVKWILPNEWGPDNTREDVNRDVTPFQDKGIVCLIKTVLHHIRVITNSSRSCSPQSH